MAAFYGARAECRIRKVEVPVVYCDFLSMYLQATDRDGRPFSDKELLDELMTLIVAGFETSANTLNCVLEADVDRFVTTIAGAVDAP